MRDFTKRKSEIVLNLASALWHLTQEGNELPDDLRAMLEHRMRDALRDGPCPACAEVALAKELDDATEG